MKLTSEKRRNVKSMSKGQASVIWYILLFISVVLLAGTLSKELSSGRPIIHDPTPRIEIPDPEPAKVFQNTSHIETLSLKATAYMATEASCDSNPNETAFGTEPFLGGVAVSQDLHRAGWSKGKIIKVHGVGLFVINDLMPKKHKKTIDILMSNKEDMKTFGVRTVTVSLLDVEVENS